MEVGEILLHEPDVFAGRAFPQDNARIQHHIVHRSVQGNGFQDAQVCVIERTPGVVVHNAGDRETEGLLERLDGNLSLLAEIAGDLYRLDRRIVCPDHCKVILQRPDVLALHSDVEIFGIGLFDLLLGDALGVQLRQIFYAGKNVGDPVPCGFVDNAGCRQPEDFLKGNDGILCDIVKIAGSFADFWNGRIVSGNAVQLYLNGADRIIGKSQPQIKSRIGGRVGHYGNIGDNVDVAAVKCGKDLIRSHALLCQRHGAPLGKPVTGYRCAVAERCEQRLHIALPPDVRVEQFVNQLPHVFENFSAVDVLLVKLSGVGDVKGIPAGAIPLSIDTVEGKADNNVDVGTNGIFRPRGVNFAGYHVFDVIGKGNGDVVRRFLRPPQMHGNISGDKGFSDWHIWQPSLQIGFGVLVDNGFRRLLQVAGQGNHVEDLSGGRAGEYWYSFADLPVKTVRIDADIIGAVWLSGFVAVQ